MSNDFRHISESTQNDVLIITIESPALNDFDLSHAVADEVDQAISRAKTDKVVVDIAAVEYLTSLGLVVFARLILQSQNSNKRIYVCNASDLVAEVLEVTQLDHLENRTDKSPLPVTASREEAILQFAS